MDTATNARKAALRSNPAWLAAVDLDTTPATLSTNAAEAWSAKLNSAGVPDTAVGLEILAARRVLDAQPVSRPVALPVATGGRPNYEVRQGSGAGWTLATLVLLVAIVGACAHVAHVAHLGL